MITILLIEDNELNCEIVSRMLTRHGFRVLIAKNGIDGITLAEKKSPHLILMDLNLPDISGFDLAKKLKNNAVTHQIPIIALTAYMMNNDDEKAILAGCDSVETKPIAFAQLICKIEKYCAKKIK